MKRFTPALSILLALTSLDAAPTASRPSSPSSSRPSSSPASRPSSPSPSPSPSKNWGSSSPAPSAAPASSPSASESWGTSGSSPAPASSSGSSADKALANKVNQSGSGGGSGAQQTRASAVVEKQQVVTQQKQAATAQAQRIQDASYRTSSGRYHYDYEPSVWPMGLPRSYYYGGYSYNIMWDPFYRGYGWYGPGGVWMYYDGVATGMAMANGGGGVVATGSGPVYVRSSFPWIGFWITILLLFTIFVIVGLIVSYNNRRRRGFEYSDEGPRRTTGIDMSDIEAELAKDPPPRTSYVAAPTVKENTTLDKMRGKADVTRVAPGDTISLRDVINMRDVKDGAKGMAVRVVNITRFQDKDGLAVFTFIRGRSAIDQALYILVKDVDQDRAITCYTEHLAGTRDELLAADANWLFVNPGTESFKPMELDYTSWFKQALDGENEDIYNRKKQGVIHGTATFNPERRGQSELLGTLVEYRTDQLRDLNQYLILELGNGDRSNVETFWGWELRDADVVPI